MTPAAKGVGITTYSKFFLQCCQLSFSCMLSGLRSLAVPHDVIHSLCGAIQRVLLPLKLAVQ